MKIIPAIDIIHGKVVRLFKGSFDKVNEYGDDPVSMAQLWQDKGADYLHVVDLDGAKVGKPQNEQVIKEIIKAVTIPVEVGGGIRTVKDIDGYFDSGADRVVLGTAVVKDPSFLNQKEIAANAHKISISIDASDSDFYITSKTGSDAWLKEVKINFQQLVDKMLETGLVHMNYTIRAKDGTLEGLTDYDLASLDSFLRSFTADKIKVIYAGGIATLNDLGRLAQLNNSALEGVIIGKALYENKFTLRQAQDIVR